jgi:hypothetical protein
MIRQIAKTSVKPLSRNKLDVGWAGLGWVGPLLKISVAVKKRNIAVVMQGKAPLSDALHFIEVTSAANRYLNLLIT